MAELQFWCQYWIIVALLTIFERVGDVLVSWLPLYGEMKLALFIYLWYPKTKGTGYIYERLLRPCLVAHEPELDRNFQEMRARAWDLAIYYWHNCTELGQTAFFQIIQFLATGKIPKPNTQKDENNSTVAAAPPPSPTGPSAFHLMADNHDQASDRRRPPLPHSRHQRRS
ncbi:hypothetical protein U1Q18_014267 [Sarracenia purpurea var. burkii]